MTNRKGAWAATALAAVILSIVLLRAFRAEGRHDPVVNGKPMSAWAFGIIANRRSYSIDREYMDAFSKDRDSAIAWLDYALNYRVSKPASVWNGVCQKLPERARKRLELDLPVITDRYAALYALSNLARKQPNRRIADIFSRATTHPNNAVRKIAAYEAGPWLWPTDHTIAASILAKALDDPRSDVRRDACRRIALSATSPKDSYTQAMLPLLPRLQTLAVLQEPFADVARDALSKRDAEPIVSGIPDHRR